MPPLAFRSVSRLSAAPSPQLGDDPPLLSSPLGAGGIRQRNPQKPSWQGPAHPPHCGCWPLRPLRLCCEGRPPEGGAGQTWAQVGGHGWGAQVGGGGPRRLHLLAPGGRAAGGPEGPAGFQRVWRRGRRGLRAEGPVPGARGASSPVLKGPDGRAGKWHSLGKQQDLGRCARRWAVKRAW